MNFRFKLRRGPAAEWTTDNPVLLAGEPGYENDTNKLKIGDGVQLWNDLEYFPNPSDLVAGVATVDGRSGDVTLTDLYAAHTHAHAQSDITGLAASLTAKADASALTAHTSNTSNPHSVTKTQVGLGNVDNTADTAKPVSTAQQTALDLKADSTALAAKADASALTAHTANTSNPHSVTKTQVGLGNVDNTADTAKPVSTAQQAALDAKAPLASPHFTTAIIVDGGASFGGNVAMNDSAVLLHTGDTDQILHYDGTATRPVLNGSNGVELRYGSYPGTAALIVDSDGTVTMVSRLNQNYDALTDASTIAIDGKLGNRFKIVLTGNHTLGNPSNAVDGQPFFFKIVQDGSGSHTLTLGAKFNDPNSYYTGLATAANACSYLGVVYDSTRDEFDVLAFSAGY